MRKFQTRPVELGQFSFKQGFGVPKGGQPMTFNRTQVPQLGVGQMGQMLQNSEMSGLQMGMNMSGMPMGLRPPQPPTLGSGFGSQPPMGGQIMPPIMGGPMGFKPPVFPSVPNQGIPGIMPSLKPPMMQNFPPNPLGSNLPKPQPK